MSSISPVRANGRNSCIRFGERGYINFDQWGKIKWSAWSSEDERKLIELWRKPLTDAVSFLKLRHGLRRFGSRGSVTRTNFLAAILMIAEVLLAGGNPGSVRPVLISGSRS